MKKIILSAGLVLMAGTIAACAFEEPEIEYDEEMMPISEAEERIADELEVKNPDYDLEVHISEELD